MCALRAGPLFADDLTPRQATDEHYFLVDLDLRRSVAEHTAKVIDFRRHQLVALRQETNGGALKIAFRNGDLFGSSPHGFAHTL